MRLNSKLLIRNIMK